MRIVIDANVFVSAAIRTGPPHQVVEAWLRDGAFDVIVCPNLLNEVREILTQRPRLRRWIDQSTAEDFLATVEAFATLVPDPDNVESVTRDPDDDYLVALARTHGADHIISGDKDLLEWASQDRFVLSPSAFADLLAR